MKKYRIKKEVLDRVTAPKEDIMRFGKKVQAGENLLKDFGKQEQEYVKRLKSKGI